jgi:hypothetical protein
LAQLTTITAPVAEAQDDDDDGSLTPLSSGEFDGHYT